MAVHSLQLNQKGYTLIELAIVTLIMGVMATTVILANRFANQQAAANSDQTFATEKAIQMYEELRALVNGNEGLGVGVLDDYSNGSTYYDQILTTDKNVDTGLASANPGDPLSGNTKTNGYWRYMRQVEVDRVANDQYARHVTVRVYLFPGEYAANNQTQPGKLLATVGGIIRTSAQPYEPTQVLDVYILEINNIPAWWDVMPTLSSDMFDALSDLQSRLPDLQIRTHFVTRSSYGRDPLYQPSTNSSANPTESTPESWVYFYPGFVPQDSPTADYYYYDPNTDTDPYSLLMDGNFMVDGTSYPVSTTQFTGPIATANISYSVADQYNNAMRYPDELATYQAVTAASALIGGVKNEGATEISERMLFENMLSKPQSFENSIIVNLHGELLPLPPIRNYSDAAKDPGSQLAAFGDACAITSPTLGNTNVRVVTHPELIYYPGATTSATAVTVRLRVYAYYDSEDEGGTFPSGDPRVPYISIFLPDASATVVGVTAIIGNSTLAYSYQTPSPGGFTIPPSDYSGSVTADVPANPMGISVSYIGPSSGSNEQTLITLLNTPLTCPINNTDHGGLNPEDTLYGEQYIPCSPVTSTSSLSPAGYLANDYSFGSDLGNDAVTAAGNPKNTARWIISLAMPITTVLEQAATIYSGTYPAGATIAGIHAIETYLGNGVTSNTFISGAVTTTIYPDISRTYVWCGDSFMPPYTEQYQFLGDPRDCPYLDIKIGGLTITGAAVTIGPNAYNWWFKNGKSTQMYGDGYTGFGASQGNSPWGSSNSGGVSVNVDLPRFYQIIRQGLLNTTSIWTTTNGWAFYYYGLGGEIGFDHSPMTNGVTIMSYPFQKTTAGEGLYGYDSINGDGKTAGAVTGLWVASNVTGSAGVTWYQRSWLGEIYPDNSYLDSWVTYGNLPTIKNTTILAAPETFYLNPKQNIPESGVGGSNDGFENITYYPMAGGDGDNSFYDGDNTSTGGTPNHYGDDDTNSDELSLGVTTYNIIPFPLPNVVDVNRPWDFNGGDPPEWGYVPYSSMRTTVSNPVIDSEDRLFYDYGGNGSSTPHGSGVVEVESTTGGVTQIGYVVETGTAPSGNVGAQTLAEADLVYAMRTFLDGGQMAVTGAPGHIVQIPLVQIYLSSSVPEYLEDQSISFTVASPVTATHAGEGAVSVGMPVTDIWWRFNPYGLANYYTEEYPKYGDAMTGTGMYEEAVSVIYNLKYSSDGGTTWEFVQDNSAAQTGVCNDSPSYAITYTAPWGYNWPVSTGTYILPQGDYLLRVEAYRQGYGEHYAYDMSNLEISW